MKMLTQKNLRKRKQKQKRDLTSSELHVYILGLISMVHNKYVLKFISLCLFLYGIATDIIACPVW